MTIQENCLVGHNSIIVCLFVCFITKSFLTFCHPHLLYQLYLGLYQTTCVQSHQRQPMSAVAITAREVQVSAADYQTVPTVATGVSKPLCCRLTVTFTLTSENLSFFTTLLLLLVLIQLCIPCCWHLDSNYCRRRCRQSQLRFVLSLLLLLLRLLGTFQLDFPRWLGQSWLRVRVHTYVAPLPLGWCHLLPLE